MNPARQTSRTPRSRSSRARARSKSSRDGKARWSMTSVSIPAAAARARPGGVRTVRDHDRDAGVEAPVAIASMSACRLLPRPEMSTPIVRAPAGVPDGGSDAGRSPIENSAAAALDGADRGRAAPPAASERLAAADAASATAATATIRPTPMLNVRSMSSPRHGAGLLEPHEERRHLPRPTVERPLGARRQHARQVVGDPAAGDVRHPLDQPRTRAAAGSRGRYERCGASSASATVTPSSGQRDRTPSPATRRRCGARASSRWCAGRRTAGRSGRRPARCAVPSISRSRSTAPTMKPATSYSPSA